MTFSLFRRLVVAGLGACLLGIGTFTPAQTVPLRVVLPIGAGSGVDMVVRAAQNALAREIGRPVVVENLPGAGGIIGTQAIVSAAPDGNTIGVVSNNHAVNPSVYRKMPFDSIKDITPICVIGATPFVLVVNPAKVPAKNAKELQALLAAKPGQYNYASPGNGTIIHLAGAMFVDAAGVDVQHVPYKGTGAQVTDLIGGQVEMGVVAVPVVQTHIRSGALRPIGIMGRERVPSLPEVPTMAEQGFPDVDIAGWVAFIGPPNLPSEQVKQLHDAVVRVFDEPEVKAAMVKQELSVHPMTPEASALFMKNEQERYAKLVRKARVDVN